MSTLRCSNPACQAMNALENTGCTTCGVPLIKRYLWAVGNWIDAYQVGDLIEERYLLKRPHVVLDTSPALKPNHPEEIPDGIKAYLKLLPWRLHIPQVYGYLPSPDPAMNLDIWLLEYGSLPLDAEGELQYPNLLPELSTVWGEASALQQLIWLWQMARLWQPLMAKGVVSSLLELDWLGVNGLNIQLRELRLDEHHYHTVKELAGVWSPLLTHVQSAGADFCQELGEHLATGKIPHAESLMLLLEQAIAELASHYQYRYQIVTRTDSGPVRDHNEDFCYPLPTPPLHKAEEDSVASQSLSKLQEKHPIKISLPREETPTENPSREVNLEELAIEDPSLETMRPESEPEVEAEAEIPPPENLVIICDGVGGQDGGEIASQLTVNQLVQEITTRLPFSWQFSQEPSEQLPYQQVLRQLEQSVKQVNDHLNHRNNEESRTDRERMGTTLVMTLADHQSLYIVNVGDSRCYWITDKSCQQLTVDDDLACREVRLGYALYREAIQLPRSGALFQAMGMATSASLHPSLQRLLIPDRSLFLLCSDGLSDFDRVEQYWQTELLPILRGEVELQAGCDRLISLANGKNGHDNVTVGLMLCQVEAPQTALPLLSYPEIEIQVLKGVNSGNASSASSQAPTRETEAISPSPGTSLGPTDRPRSTSLKTPVSLKAGMIALVIGVLGLLGLFGYSFLQGLTGRSPSMPAASPKAPLLENTPVETLSPTTTPALETSPIESVSPSPTLIPPTAIPTSPIPTISGLGSPVTASPVPEASVPTTPIPTPSLSAPSLTSSPSP